MIRFATEMELRCGLNILEIKQLKPRKQYTDAPKEQSLTSAGYANKDSKNWGQASLKR